MASGCSWPIVTISRSGRVLSASGAGRGLLKPLLPRGCDGEQLPEELLQDLHNARRIDRGVRGACFPRNGQKASEIVVLIRNRPHGGLELLLLSGQWLEKLAPKLDWALVAALQCRSDGARRRGGACRRPRTR